MAEYATLVRNLFRSSYVVTNPDEVSPDIVSYFGDRGYISRLTAVNEKTGRPTAYLFEKSHKKEKKTQLSRKERMELIRTYKGTHIDYKGPSQVEPVIPNSMLACRQAEQRPQGVLLYGMKPTWREKKSFLGDYKINKKKLHLYTFFVEEPRETGLASKVSGLDFMKDKTYFARNVPGSSKLIIEESKKLPRIPWRQRNKIRGEGIGIRKKGIIFKHHQWPAYKK